VRLNLLISLGHRRCLQTLIVQAKHFQVFGRAPASAHHDLLWRFGNACYRALAQLERAMDAQNRMTARQAIIL
jgi:hypothetical protein